MKLKGVPQGAPFSPLLSLIALNQTIFRLRPQYHEALMYADDGLLYGDGLVDFKQGLGPWPSYNPEIAEAGIRIHPGKSG